jgi:hypothetical protein
MQVHGDRCVGPFGPKVSDVFSDARLTESRGAIEPGRGTVVGRTLLEAKTVHVHDLQSDPEYTLSRVKDYRCTLGVPLLVRVFQSA